MKNSLIHQKGYVAPFLKWVGGKGQLLEQFQRFLPSTLTGRHYVEPFMGSGAVFFYVKQNLNPASCTLLDINPELVNTFQQIRDNVEEVIGLLAEHHLRHNAEGITEELRKEYYYSVRALLPEILSFAERASRFIYLNKTCFNGLHRINSRGFFNVPMGSYRLPKIYDAFHLREVSALLQSVTIEVCPFQMCEQYITPGSFTYFDPPYEPLSATSSFTGYAKMGFTADNQRELRDLVMRLSAHSDCMISNSTAPLIEELYEVSFFQKHHVLASRAINSNAQGRGKIKELVITNYAVDVKASNTLAQNDLFSQVYEPVPLLSDGM